MDRFSSMRLAVNTQTPVVRIVDGEPRQTTGGVVRMLVPLLRRWQADGRVRDVRWVAMGSEETAEGFVHEGLALRSVPLADEPERRGYALVKERMWALLNSNPSTGTPHGADGVPPEAWAAFDAYQARSARALEEAAREMGGIDLLYVHDFQQIGVASAWRGPHVPRIFHLHTPFPSALPPGWADYFVDRLRAYDRVVVSTRRYAENLRDAGLETPIQVIHPFIDPAAYGRAGPADVAAFRARFGIAEGDRVVLNVGRMDPMKAQDRLIEAMPEVLKAVPDGRLVLVGNGSFSSSRRGGLGLDKGRAWRAELEALARKLGIESRVTFTGHLDDVDIPAAYEACEVFALPSTREGFGLAAIEAWRHRKPVVVSERAGVSELVEHGENGLVVSPHDAVDLAQALIRLMRGEDEARAMGDAGFATSRLATIDTGRERLERLIAGIVEAPHALA